MRDITFSENVDVVVVGAGHAGCEAALASARLGLNTVIFTVSIMDARSIRRSRLYGFVAFYLACIAVAAVTPFTGWLFRIDSGFHPGPLNWMIYGVSGCFLMFSLFTVLHNLRHLTTHEVISLTAMQGVLFVGAVVRFLVPNYIVMSTFCLMVICTCPTADTSITIPRSRPCCPSAGAATATAGSWASSSRITTNTGRSSAESRWTKPSPGSADGFRTPFPG